MVAVPVVTPVTTPPETVATAGLPLLQTPPEVTSDKVTELPVHTVGLAGRIVPGALFTVATVVTEQPAIVYEIVAVPTVLPVTTPPDVTEAMPEALLLHAPPAVASVSVAAPPKQIVTGVGVTAAGVGLTVTVTKEEQ